MNITLPDDLERPILDVVDGDRFTSANDLVADAVRDFLRRHRPRRRAIEGESAYDVLVRSGVLGSVKSEPGSPRDLSTNPIHMEGFGENDQDR